MLPWLLLMSLPGHQAGSCRAQCCPGKNVGGVDYTFSHKSVGSLKANCSDDCLYTKDGGDGKNFCFTDGDQVSQCTCAKLPTAPKRYCQPGESCWPTPQNITNFRQQIGSNNTSCLGLKKFVQADDEAAHNHKTCLPYTGLRPTVGPGSDHTCNSTSPDLSCVRHPFTSGAYYKHNDTNNQFACMTPYQFLTNRNFNNEWMPAFVVTAENRTDISAAIIFATTHNLGISVMSTGHDLQDRNAGPGPNSLLIRTTCFQDWKVINKTVNTGDECSSGTTWYDGYAKVGAGLTFGQNFWRNLNNSRGTYALAAESGKETVGGTCASVGIVGWTLGGGHGWTAPMYGLGVDQLIHVDFVAANGSFLSANHSHNSDFFYAIRGGGGGFGIIYNLHIKLHNASCLSGMAGCYTRHIRTWTGQYIEGPVEQSNSTAAYVKKMMLAWSAWSLEKRPTWNAFFWLSYDKPNYTVWIRANQFGHNDSQSFNDAMAPFTKHQNSNQNWTTVLV
jgi:hypothetical protein